MRGEDLRKASWQRCAKEFELKMELSNGLVHKFGGFQRDVSIDVVDDDSLFKSLLMCHPGCPFCRALTPSPIP
jgi:hypothetical protein